MYLCSTNHEPGHYLSTCFFSIVANTNPSDTPLTAINKTYTQYHRSRDGPEMGDVHTMSGHTQNDIMAGHAFVVAKEVFHHRNRNILKLWEWLNDDKHFFLFKFNYINKHLQLKNNFYHLKLRYTDPGNLFTKRALVSQPSTLMVGKDSNILHYLNLSINSPMIILPII